MQFGLTERRMDFLPYLIVDDQRRAPYLTAAAAPQVRHRGGEDLDSQAADFTDSC
jgi:hypothetical protein